MGKILIINGADFSQNGITFIPEKVLLHILDEQFRPQYSLYAYTGTHGEIQTDIISNDKRSCVFAVDVTRFADLGFTKITINFKIGYSIVLGIGTTSSSAEYYSGDCVAGTFEWITDSQTASCPLSNTKRYLYINFRNSDNTTVMASNGKASDYIDSIVLS